MNKRSVAGRVEVAGGCHLDQSIMLWKVTVGRADEPTPSDTLTLSGMVGTASRGSTTRHYREDLSAHCRLGFIEDASIVDRVPLVALAEGSHLVVVAQVPNLAEDLQISVVRDASFDPEDMEAWPRVGWDDGGGIELQLEAPERGVVLVARWIPSSR
ncbi:MAG: hypothetical protein V9G12_03805 [Microthrixaceae bacterium]|jgi:hypothetical protein